MMEKKHDREKEREREREREVEVMACERETQKAFHKIA